MYEDVTSAMVISNQDKAYGYLTLTRPTAMLPLPPALSAASVNPPDHCMLEFE